MTESADVTINPFDFIKENLLIADVVKRYGVKVKRGNKALCPLHNERTPSFTVYPDTNSWNCFGCGVGGSAIDFIMTYYGLDALEAAKKLDADYNLGLFDYKPSQEEMYRQSEQRAQSQKYKGLAKTFEVYMNKAYIILCDYLRLLEDWKIIYAPKTPEGLDTVNPLFVEACHQLDYIEYLLDCLSVADYEEQIQFYKTHRKEMVHIAAKVKRYSKSTNADESACC